MVWAGALFTPYASMQHPLRFKLHNPLKAPNL
ncbi:MAG: hypothetical protein MAG451_02031 [Anaerolineales bacterium]|nr:hypothetical protein [Anaerolineales bacterium]